MLEFMTLTCPSALARQQGVGSILCRYRRIESCSSPPLSLLIINRYRSILTKPGFPARSLRRNMYTVDTYTSRPEASFSYPHALPPASSNTTPSLQHIYI